MTVWQLFRALLRHILHGRGGDEVGAAVLWDTGDDFHDLVTGTVREVRWDSDADKLFMLEAFTPRPEHRTAPAAGLLWWTRDHNYLSTACLHNEHDYCRNTHGQAGPKVPGKCKFCDARCACVCHREGGDGEQ